MKSTVKPLPKDNISRELEQYDYEIVSIAYLDETEAKKSPRSVLNSYKLLVMLDGQASIHIGRITYYTRRGDCVLFGPGSLYHAEISGPGRCRFVAVNFNLLSPLQDKKFRTMLGLKDVAVIPGIISDVAMDQLYTVAQAAVREEYGCYHRVLMMLHRLISATAFSNRTAKPEKPKENHAIGREQTGLKCHRFIINNPDTAVTVDMLCSQCNVSQSYLYKCFRSVLGISTKDFITKTKLDMAARSLLQTDKSIVAIAREFGYSNSYRFSNIFKKAYGVSPTAYRKANR